MVTSVMMSLLIKIQQMTSHSKTINILEYLIQVLALSFTFIFSAATSNATGTVIGQNELCS